MHSSGSKKMVKYTKKSHPMMELNPLPLDLQTNALPTELQKRCWKECNFKGIYMRYSSGSKNLESAAK